MFEKEIHTLYKPFRNHLRPVSIENALYVIWAYINFYQFDEEFPKDIEVNPIIKEEKGIPNKRLNEWKLALLAREALSNCSGHLGFAKKGLSKWRYFAYTIDKLIFFESNAWNVYGTKDNVTRELRRLTHRQFPWQERPNSALFLRYFMILNNPKTAEIIKQRIGLTIQQWYTLGALIFGAMLKLPKFNINPEIVVPSITRIEFDIFIRFVSDTFINIRQKIKETKYNDEFIYSFNPLEYKPLVLIGNHYYCPINTFLAWRTTSGLYYDLINDSKFNDGSNFGNTLGFAFQSYIEKISEVLISDKSIKMYKEKDYGSNRDKKASIDLILSNESCALFIEVKAKRMRSKSKSELISEVALTGDMEILATEIVEAYATINDYLQNKYEHFKYNSRLEIFLLIITLEDWYLMGEDADNLREKVNKKLSERNLPVSCLEDMPYAILSTKDYEFLCQVLSVHNICDVMKPYFLPDKKSWLFGGYLREQFKISPKDITQFFPGDFERIFPEGLFDGYSNKMKSD